MPMNFLMLFLRHGLTSLGGALAAKGFITSAAVEPFVGAGMVLAGVAMSIMEKLKRQ